MEVVVQLRTALYRISGC